MTVPKHALGGRLPLLSMDGLDQAQMAQYQEMVSGTLPWAKSSGFACQDDMGRFIGPFNAVLYSPEMWGSFSATQAKEQGNTSLTQRTRQVVILTVGSVWQAPYELYAHSAVAAKAGLTPQQIDSLSQGELPQDISPEESSAQRFVHQLVAKHTVDDVTYATAQGFFGDRGLVEMVLLAGCYLTVCASLRAFEVPAPLLSNES